MAAIMKERAEDLIRGIGHTLVSATPHAVIVVDHAHRIRFVNAAAEGVFGYSRERMLSETLDLLIPPADRERHCTHVRRFAESGKAARWMGDRSPIRGLHADGTIFPAEAAISLVETEGEPLFVAILTDRTESVEMANRLQQFADILERTPDIVGMADEQGRVTYLNAAGRQLLSRDVDTGPNAGSALRVADAHPAWAARKVLDEAFPAALSRRIWRGQTAFRGAQGEEVPVDQVIIGHADANGEVHAVSTIARDMREQHRLEDELRGLAQALEQCADMVWITDAEGVIEYVNPAFEEITGYSRTEAIGKTPGDILSSGRRSKDIHVGLRQRLLRGETFRGVFTNRTRDRRIIHVDETITPVRDTCGTIRRFIATGRDISEQYQVERELRRMAHFDPVTGLHNRQYFEKQLLQEMRAEQAPECTFAVVVVDIDRFKDINDSLGHAAGDMALRHAGQQITAAVRSCDLVARHGGDELIVLLRQIDDPESIRPIMERMMLRVREPLRLSEDRSTVLSSSVGIALYPEAGDSADQLLKAADAAMYRAKKAGGNQFAFHSRDLDRIVLERWSLIRALDDARLKNQFTLQYQPIVEPLTHSLRGVEALVRWHHPERGLLGPSSFVPLAEETHQIRALGFWVLEEVCRQVAAWLEAEQVVPHVSVNVSAVQLDDVGFSDGVQGILAKWGVAAERIVLEITEGTLMSSATNVAGNLDALRSMGVAIAIDDFGTGYCSLGYLKRFPVDFIKIDREFIRGVASDQGNRAIVESIVTFGNVFDCWIVAEGIETHAEMDALARMGIRLVQGFLVEAPVWPASLERDWLARQSGGKHSRHSAAELPDQELAEPRGPRPQRPQ